MHSLAIHAISIYCILNQYFEIFHYAMSDNKAPTLEQLLHRPDIWRGHSSSFVKQETIDTGFSELNNALQHKGWPTGCLIEICQHFYASEWWIFHRSISTILGSKNDVYLALINPPALPFIAGLEQRDIPSKQIIIVKAHTPQEFITSFTELNKSSAFAIVLAWQTNNIQYSQLRKIQLSTSESKGIYALFSPMKAKLNSSPASLRLSITPKTNTIDVHIFKQKGKLRKVDVQLSIPDDWCQHPSHRELLNSQEKSHYETNKKGEIALLPKIRLRSKKELKSEYH